MHMHIPSHSYCKDVTFFYGTKLTRWTLAGMYSTYHLTNLTRSWCLGFVHRLKVKFTGKPSQISQFWGKKKTVVFQKPPEAGQAVGPYPVSHCRHWVGEGRLNGHTKVGREEWERAQKDSNDMRRLFCLHHTASNLEDSVFTTMDYFL